MSDKLSLNNELRMLDTKHREFYDELEDHEQKKFSPYVMMRYSASVEGDPDFQEWYLRAANERVNQNFFDVSTSKHKKLQWLLCTTVSPNMGQMRHYWIATKKEEKLSTPAVKLLRKLYPKMKLDEIELLASVNDIKEIKKYAALHGMDDQDIKKVIK
jgi:hypothetical protein